MYYKLSAHHNYDMVNCLHNCINIIILYSFLFPCRNLQTKRVMTPILEYIHAGHFDLCVSSIFLHYLQLYCGYYRKEMKESETDHQYQFKNIPDNKTENL